MDIDRVMYLRNYLGQLQKVIAEGIPVKGYFVWSLLDNFEWADG
jgi:beta-glucosidase